MDSMQEDEARACGARPDEPTPAWLDRRAAVQLGLAGALAALVQGCASSSTPSPLRGLTDAISQPLSGQSARSERSIDGASEARTAVSPHRRARREALALDEGDEALPTAPAEPFAPPPSLRVTPRSAWAKGPPILSRMDRQSPIRRITVHHDGLPPVTLRTRSDVARRLELIRVSHLQRGFGDIGYHYIVDPMGGIWEGRSLLLQGAHVAHQNPGNLGVMALGNFEEQQPTQPQLRALDAFVALQMRRFRVPVSRLYTHRELASTLCPGRNLQRHMIAARSAGGPLYLL